MKEKIEIYGISQEVKIRLKFLSARKYGKPNISRLLKEWITLFLKEDIETPLKEISNKQKIRIEVRISQEEKELLNKLAENHCESPNLIIGNLIATHLKKDSLLSTAEIEALHQSNYQLLSIGRNINQIAKMMNSHDGNILPYETIKTIKDEIDDHTNIVGNLLIANRRRFEGA